MCFKTMLDPVCGNRQITPHKRKAHCIVAVAAAATPSTETTIRAIEYERNRNRHRNGHTNANKFSDKSKAQQHTLH